MRLYDNTQNNGCESPESSEDSEDGTRAAHRRAVHVFVSTQEQVEQPESYGEQT